MTTSYVDIYWDFENIRPSSTTKLIDVTNIIRARLFKYGVIRTRNLYIDSQSPSELSTKRGELNLSGWSIIDCPHRGKSEVIDKKLSMIFYGLLFTVNIQNIQNNS